MKRSKHNLSHYKLGSCDMGKLYPISCFEVLPGDTVQMHTSVFIRFAPMVSPVMHPIKISTYFFFIPYRLLWSKWEDFITGGADGLDTSTPPYATFDKEGSGVTTGSLMDYLGIPIGYKGPFSIFPVRAYHRIWNEYFRDQDITDEVNAGTFNGDQSSDLAPDNAACLIHRVAWEKDYFTTARPLPQKGATVIVPVNGINSGTYNVKSVSGSPANFFNSSYTDVSSNEVAPSISPIFMSPDRILKINNPALTTPTEDVQGSIRFPANQNIGSVTIPANTGANVHLDDLREAFALQRFEEHRSVYGSRYTEYLRYLGVRARDSRLQRPEYLGGSKSTVQLSEVLQTAADGDNPVGTLRGHGIGLNRSRTFRRYIEENGLIMGLMTIRPVAIYMNGLHKMFSRTVKEDFWQKELEHIGQQEVLEKELFATGDTTSPINDNTVFGFQNRYDDYRSVPSTVCGEMRNTLDYWHMARSFENAPVLNTSFLYGSPTKRIFAEQTMNEIYFMAQNTVVARRLLSKQGNPIM